MTSIKKAPRCAIVLCHPRPDSFCASVAAQVEKVAHEAGYETILRDLYAMAFDPVLHARDIVQRQGGSYPAPDVAMEITLLAQPEVVVLVYPIWFGSAPGMLKGYVERVLGAGFAGPGFVPVPAGPRPSILLTVATSGATDRWIEKKGIAASAGRLFGAYIAGALAIPQATHIAVDNVLPDMSQARGADKLAKVEAALREILPNRQTAKGGKRKTASAGDEARAA